MLKYAYLAGLVDGDGYVCYRVYHGGRYRYPTLEVASLDVNFLKKIGDEFGKYCIRRSTNAWRLTFNLPDSRKLLSHIKNYSILKQSDIRCVLAGEDIIRDRTPARDVWEAMTKREKEAYLAGMLDAEGSISLVKVKNGGYGKCVKISQKNREFLKLMSETFGGTYTDVEWRIPLKSIDKMEAFLENIRNDNKRMRMETLYEMRKYNFKLRTDKSSEKILDRLFERFRKENFKYVNDIRNMHRVVMNYGLCGDTKINSRC